jgi:hypothetical protein
MIKNITQSGAFTQVSSYSTPNIYNTGQSAGEVRYNTNTQHMEVYDGSTWISISQSPTVGLSLDAEEAIRWAREKMVEESALKERLEKHPGLKDAYEKFQIMDILTKVEDEQSAE